MEQIFIKILNMSISAGWIVLAVVLLRNVLKKAPKYIRCILWAAVGIRLVCPFSFESIFSLVPSAETVPQEIMLSHSPQLNTGIGSLDQVINPIVSESFAPEPYESANPLQVLGFIAAVVWLTGVAAMLIYALFSYIALKKKVSASLNLRSDIFLCDNIDSPFILGMIKPRIFVPSGIDEQSLASVEAHERAHLARKDHWWKPLGYAMLCVHWFNPLIWLAYSLLCKDIELACDEKVIADMGLEEKKKYSSSLLNCSIDRRRIAACPLAFGEVGVKDRIKSVLNHKKATVWVVSSALIVCIIFCICFLTDPIETNLDKDLEAFLSETIIEQHSGHYKEGEFKCESHTVLGTKRQGNRTTVYMLVMYSEYNLTDGVIVDESGSHIPTVITVDKTENGYELVEFWLSSDGTRYVPSIREKYPWYLENTAINIHLYAPQHKADCIAQAEEYFGVKYIDPYADMTFSTTTAVAGDFRKVPPLSEVAKLSSEEATQRLYSFSKQQLLDAWGEPDSCLSGLYGDIWEDEESGMIVIVYYNTWQEDYNTTLIERAAVCEKQVTTQTPVDCTAHYIPTERLSSDAPAAGVFLIKSKAELDAYYEQYRKYYYDLGEKELYDSVLRFGDYRRMFDAQFFEDKALILVIESYPTNSEHPKVNGVFADDSTDTLLVSLLKDSNTADGNMTTLHIIIEIPKDALRNNISVIDD